MTLLYIDPGTGSMLFTILLGAITTLYFFVRKLIVYLRFRASGGKVSKEDMAKIPYLIFSDNRQYWTVFKPICDEFERRQVPLVYWTASEEDPGLTADYKYVERKFIGKGNHAFAKLNIMNAGICLATTPGLDVLQWKRSKNVDWYVHILHAAGTSAAGYRMFSLDYYDAVLLTGDFQIDEIRELETKRNLPPKELEVIGCTYMDAMWERLQKEEAEDSGAQNAEVVSAEAEKTGAQDAEAVSTEAEKTGAQNAEVVSTEAKDTSTPNTNAQNPDSKDLTVLLAPSWGTSSILCRYGRNLMDALAATGYKIIMRPHPQSFVSDKAVMDELQAAYPDSDQISWNSDSDNFEALRKADIMISDFSSVIFDYTLIFNKPVIYAENTFNKDPYDAAWLDDEMWKFKVLPSIGLPLKEEDFPNLKQIIQEAVVDTKLGEGREQARKEAWAHIGESARLTADYMIEKYQTLKNKEQ